MEIPYTVSARRDTGLWNAKVGIWLFLASEVMLFGGLFSAYIKEGALENYEPYLGNKHLLEEGLPPRKEITGHLHNKEALKNPSVKEYEIALDPVYADPTNRKMDRPHFWPMPATDKIATI